MSECIQLSFAVCRIGIYTRAATLERMCLLCFRALCCKGPPPPRPEYDLVCIGLTGSGKTSLLSQLCSESPENIVSTTGFSIKAVPFQNAILNVKELGGADNIRKYWSRYYQGSQGVIFVLDSASSEDDLETARNELHSALQHPQLCTLPFLILANHQDKPAARSVQEFTDQLYGIAFKETPVNSKRLTNSQQLSEFLSKNTLNLSHLHVESAGFLNPAPWMIWRQ
ncbi:ADP-ribosylation factor-like protein 15 isoform X2 [Anser cygnoides]|uniref:ADP-ribosylation factor-like protein 15 isoform X2 n=1 Tax=Anser cygnoides TaxID=8845 RepID=UPI0020098E2F|nr:ADP-ribosylation factor-like protein 15 isoform X2 [Anser cygnoides]XP_047906346.1 ADP-ribosylation factor-like protein 15 isoform X2 [Anser cygnoides]